MSEKALVESIHVEMKQHFTQGEKYLLVTPGNYGADYLREHMPYLLNEISSAAIMWEKPLIWLWIWA